MIQSALLASFLSALLTVPARCQAPLAQDVGLYLDGGLLTVVYGQECGPVSCTPFQAGFVGGGETRTLFHFSAAVSLYAVAIGFPGACVTLPGFDNPLLLSDPVILSWGLTSAPPFSPTQCDQGIANATLAMPVGTPAGITFRLQSLGQSNSGAFAFGPAIEAQTF